MQCWKRSCKAACLAAGAFAGQKGANLQHVREEEEQARVHARAQAYGRQDAEPDPPDHELRPVLRFIERTLSSPCR